MNGLIIIDTDQMTVSCPYIEEEYIDGKKENRSQPGKTKTR